nr:MAG TPA: hypothetical protein [Caudoviricetes sp.]
MPLSEESDPFARRHFAGSSGGETVPPWNGASGTRARCPVRVDQVQPEPVPDGPGHAQPGRTRPASISSRNEKARVNGLRRPPWLFFCPRPAPISTAAATISTGKDRAAHGDGLPDHLPGLGGVGLPDEQRTARPISCPACSFQPDPAAALMTPPPCCPHPCQTYRQRQPPARQHPAASPTPEGSDSPPNGIWL